MARHGITYDDVTSAANVLKSEGKNVTIENVRRVLGTGSAGTLNQHLRRWKDAQNTTLKIASKENIPESLIYLVKNLWEGVVAQSNEQFIPKETHYQQEISELKTEVEKYRANNQRWQKMFNQWQQDKVALDLEKLALQQALEFSHKENESLSIKFDNALQQLQDKKNRIDELHRLHQQTQANLEHYRESAREQRLLDQQQFEREKSQYLAEIKELKDSVMLQHVKYSELSQQAQFIERAYAECEAKLNQVNSVNDSLSKKNIEHEHVHQHLKKQYGDLQVSFEKRTSEVVKFQSDNLVLKQRTDELIHSVQTLHDQNKLLTIEKLEILQEKAQLEGQLKQLQKSFVRKQTRVEV